MKTKIKFTILLQNDKTIVRTVSVMKKNKELKNFAEVMEAKFAQQYRLNVNQIDEYLDGQLGFDTEVIKKILKNQGYKVTYNDETEYIIVKKVKPTFKEEIEEYKKGGEITDYSGEYFSIRDFVNSNKGIDEIITKLYKGVNVKYEFL
jgi:hypothetical protein